ncbi:EF-hand domain-containing protein [Bacillus sp. NP157]|nr:EF-hand domain-containing protein [Bacillus sp. NP157]
MQFPRLIVSLALASSLTGAAFAQSAQPQAQPAQAAHPQVEASGQSAPPSASGASSSSDAPSFSDLDTKGKGYIQRSDIPKDNEALKPLRAHFNEADQDHNGRVDAAEYNAYVSKSKAPQQTH